IEAGSKGHQQNACRGRQFIHTPHLLDSFWRDLSYSLLLLIGLISRTIPATELRPPFSHKVV
ncbi:MAG: hypothetical protein WBA02_06070, partial [Jannaschia helgolandensis]|uniref:hypothetical protein n=1 Tax=Jannaschia helgolandensis TaxID=188906 RepID=UPI003C78D73F